MAKRPFDFDPSLNRTGATRDGGVNSEGGNGPSASPYMMLGIIFVGTMAMLSQCMNENGCNRSLFSKTKIAYNVIPSKDEPENVARWTRGKRLQQSMCDVDRAEVILEDGASYIGNMDHGYMHGIGVLTESDGGVLKGLYDKNIFQRGVLTDVTMGKSERYTGEATIDAKPHGKGQVKLKNGSLYTGEFEDRKLLNDGNVVMTLLDGTQYQGGIIDRYPQGHGSYTDSFGKTYSGDWDHGCLSDAAPLKMQLNIFIHKFTSSHRLDMKYTSDGICLSEKGSMFLGQQLFEAKVPYGHPFEGISYGREQGKCSIQYQKGKEIPCTDNLPSRIEDMEIFKDIFKK